jgi:hypothetical protein
MTANTASFVEIYTAYARCLSFRAVPERGCRGGAGHHLRDILPCLALEPTGADDDRQRVALRHRGNLYRHELRHVRRREPLDPAMASAVSVGGGRRIEGRVRVPSHRSAPAAHAVAGAGMAGGRLGLLLFRGQRSGRLDRKRLSESLAVSDPRPDLGADHAAGQKTKPVSSL